MTESTSMTVHLSPELSEKLAALARDTNRSAADLAGEAIASYVDLNARQAARIKAALEDARSGTPGVPHEEVVKWVRSWGTDNELPRPKPKV